MGSGSPDSLADLVRQVLPANVDIGNIISEFSASVEREIDELIALRDAGESVIPEVDGTALLEQGFTDAEKALIKKRGCVIVRQTVSEQQATLWNLQITDYLKRNRYYQGLQAAIEQGDQSRAKHPHILDIFWSPSQLQMRQSVQVHDVQRHLNRLWKVADTGEGAFDTDQTCIYADRLRIRKPGDRVRGLPPHVDSCTLESWYSADSIWHTYKSLLNGQWQQYDAFDAGKRVSTERKPYPSACGMFRSFQGWMALTAQGKQSGTLQLVPSARCIGWLFLDMLNCSLQGIEQNVPKPGHSFNLDVEKHALLIRGLCIIPDIKAGDTVWWHPDVVHAVESRHESPIPSSVAYLGNAPSCPRNRAYLGTQTERFKKGFSPPDFPATDLEANFAGRGTAADLSELGAIKMGLTANKSALG